MSYDPLDPFSLRELPRFDKVGNRYYRYSHFHAAGIAICSAALVAGIALFFHTPTSLAIASGIGGATASVLSYAQYASQKHVNWHDANYGSDSDQSMNSCGIGKCININGIVSLIFGTIIGGGLAAAFNSAASAVTSGSLSALLPTAEGSAVAAGCGALATTFLWKLALLEQGPSP